MLGVSPCVYHAYSQRLQHYQTMPSRMSNDALLNNLKVIHREVKNQYSWPRTHKELVLRRIRVGKERVRKLMQQHGVRVKHKRNWVATTDSKQVLPIAPN